MNWYAWAWIGWIGYFAAVEAVAVVQSVRARRAGAADPRDTLSEHVWYWFGVNSDGEGIDRDVNTWARLRRVVLAGFLVWLAVHLIGGGGIF